MSYTGAVPDTEPARAWLTNAPCKTDPDAMFPGSLDHDIEQAKTVCRGCSVIERCLQWALDTGEEHGVWGGLSEKERRRLLRNRPIRRISVDDYTGIPATRTPIAGRTLQEAWDSGIEPDGEHLRWLGKRAIHHIDGAVTPNRLAFYLDRGRWPEGEVRRMCRAQGCVKPSHLTDRAERAEEAELAVAV